MKELFKMWFSFGKFGWGYFIGLVKALTLFFMWIFVFIFYPIAERIINREFYAKIKHMKGTRR